MKRVIFILIGAIIVFFAGVYLFYQPKTDRFPARTTINEIDVSGLTPREAVSKMSEDWKSRSFTFDYKGNLYTVPMSSLSFDVPADSVMSSLTHLEKFRYFLRMGNTFQVPISPDGAEGFLAKISEMSICDNAGKVKTEDAYVDMSDFEFNVVKEKVGTEVDPNNVLNIALASIENGEFSAELTDEAIVRQPVITSESEEIAKRLKYCKDNLDFKLEYEIDGEKEVISPEMLDELADYSGDSPVLNNDRIAQFADDLAARCNEYNETYSFTTHNGREIWVEGVTFGNVIDKAGMRETLAQALMEQKSQELEVKWALYKYSGGDGIGDSYIEISIPEQHVWCYKNGTCIVDCDCVTGAPGHDTVKGVFIIQNVTGPMTLKGTNDDGSKYESPVNCFMPFYGDQGLHGSNGWRSKWGGNIYKTAGSHGCVNCPDAAAKKIANNVCWGYPVVIY